MKCKFDKGKECSIVEEVSVQKTHIDSFPQYCIACRINRLCEVFEENIAVEIRDLKIQVPDQ